MTINVNSAFDLRKILPAGGVVGLSESFYDINGPVPPNLFMVEPSVGGVWADSGRTVPATVGGPVVALSHPYGGGGTGAIVGSGITLVQNADGRALRCTGAGRFDLSGVTVPSVQDLCVLVVSRCNVTGQLSAWCGFQASVQYDLFCYRGTYTGPDGVSAPPVSKVRGLFSFKNDGVADVVRENGVQLGTSVPVAAGTNVSTISLFATLNSNVFAFKGDLYAFCLGTAGQMAALETYLAKYPPPAVGTDKSLVVADGDSIPYGNNATLSDDAYPEVACSGLSTAVYCRNLCKPGAFTQINIDRAAAAIDPYYNAARAKNGLIFQEIHNSVAVNESAANIYAQHQTYGTARRAVGWNPVIFLDCLPSTALVGANETTRAAVNASLAADFTTATSNTYVKAWSGGGTRYGDYLIKASTITGLTDPSGPNYDDGTHLNTAGHALVAPVLLAALQSAGF